VRGELRVYLGAAPGVGKTVAMLQEGRRRNARGDDVVVGLIESHGRARTEELLDGLVAVPRREVRYRGAVFTELDTPALLARHPRVALVDELAHTNVPGSGNARRWQDVEELLDAGIDVVTTVNIQHLDSVHDTVEQIIGVRQRETIPDEVVRRADEVELVDIAPEALRVRMMRGDVFSGERVEAALSHYFQVANLTALREIALIWLADEVGDQLDQYRTDRDRAERDRGGQQTIRERIVVALSGGAEGDTLLRRAAGIAARTQNADLVAVHVTRSDGLAGSGPEHLARQRDLVESMGGSYHQVLADHIPTALLQFAHRVNATQLVLGASRRGWLSRLFSAGVGATIAARSTSVDVHLAAHEQAPPARRREAGRGEGRGVPARRRRLGFAVAVAGLPLLTLALANRRGTLALPSDLVLFLGAVVGVALIGGIYPALAAALAAAMLLNYFFTPPLHEFAIASVSDLVALVVVVVVAVAVSVVVDRSARRAREAAAAAAEAETLSILAGSVLRGQEPLAALLAQVRETFAMTSVALLERVDTSPPTPRTGRDPAKWQVAAADGQPPCPAPDHGDVAIPVDDDLVLVLRGHPLAAADRRILETAAVQAAVALRQQRLADQAEHAALLAEGDRMRRALLAAVSHDLRTPLAAASAAVDSLAGQIVWTPEQRGELFATAQESLARLAALVENLVDMSRLQADAVGVALRPIALDEAVPRALDDAAAGLPVELDIPDTLPEVQADPALLQRVLVNVLANATRFSPGHAPPRLAGSTRGQQVELRIVDHGPGIPATDRDAAFRPFQRLGDHDNGSGIGLGLALARGLTEAMGGTLTAADTPGGGLTMILTLAAVE
jgi:two-component system sensor histidine kinase KdpD